MKLPNFSSMDAQIYNVDTNIIDIEMDYDTPHTYTHIDKVSTTKKKIKFIKTLESLVRQSDEYKRYIKYLKEEADLTACSFFSKVDITEIKRVGIEFHHYPFTLFDITNIVLDTHYDPENLATAVSLDPLAIADEIVKLHYDGYVGLVPLSKTLHKLAHRGEIFINLNKVHGNVEGFMEKYQMDEDLIDKYNILKDLSEDNYDTSDILRVNLQNLRHPEHINLADVYKILTTQAS